MFKSVNQLILEFNAANVSFLLFCRFDSAVVPRCIVVHLRRYRCFAEYFFSFFNLLIYLFVCRKYSILRDEASLNRLRPRDITS